MAFPPLFLSYASDDLPFAQIIHDRLTAACFGVWFDKVRLAPGFQWHKEIEAACNAARIVLPVLSPRWKNSQWTRYETYGAESVIPLLVEGRWEDVSTPPLTPFQNFCVPLASATGADWQRLFDSIREFCAREVPRKDERVQRLRYHPAKHFVGREKDLEEIHEKLFTNPTAALTQGHVQAIAAMGGVGKTTLARQYAEKFWRCYPQMFWADCRLGLETEFAAIHDILRPEPMYAALSTKDKAGWVRFEFSQSANRPRRLLILDNAEDEDSVLEWIPKTGNCHTLITSRFTDWSPGVETYRVWVLDPEPARELLLRRSGRADTPAEREACDAVAKKLEYLPLTLEQAAAYVGAQPPGWGFADYLRLYEANERAFLTKKTPGATEYPDSVYLTWRATIDRLSQGARAILRLHAFLASTPTPVAMFVRGVGRIVEEAKLIAGEIVAPLDEDIEGAGEFAVREWVSALAKYSMAQLQPEDSFSVYGLVHVVEWHALGEKKAGVFERTTNLFLAYAETPSWEPESRRMWDVLLPHAAGLSESAKRLQVQPNIDLLDHMYSAYARRGQYAQAIPLLRECWSVRKSHLGETHAEVIETQDALAFYLRANGEYMEAERLQKDVVATRQRLLGDSHIDTIGSFHNLAFIYSERGRYNEAEALYRRALAGYEKELGPQHRNTLTCLQDLGVLLAKSGDYAAGTPLVKRASEAFDKTLGPAHPDALMSVGNLAVLLHASGDRATAESLCRRALEAEERVLGLEHPSTLGSVNRLAGMLASKGDYSSAEPLERRVLEARERVLGPNHPETLASVNSLTSLLYRKGDYAGAEALSRRSLEARDRMLGPNHPDTLASVNNLAVLLESKGDYAAAEPFYRRALEGLQHVLGPEHPDTLSSVNNLAALLESKGDYAAAEPLYRSALEAKERVLGPEHLDTLVSVGGLASLLYRKGDYVAAELLYRRALEARERVLGPEHPDTLTSVNNLASLLERKGSYVVAEPLARRALEARERVLGPDHPDTLSSVHVLALLLKRKGDYAGAEPLTRRALEARERVLGPEHPDTLTSVNNLATLLMSGGDCAAAEPLFRRSLETRGRVLGPNHPDTLASVDNLANLLKTNGDYAAAEPLFRRALEARERALGPEHPDTLLALKNVADLLAKTDHLQESAALRKEYIGRMATKEASAPLWALRQLALECYRDGDYPHAEQLLRRVLEAHFEVAGTHCHLARVLLLMGRNQEAQFEVGKACENRADWQPFTGQRVCFFQVVFALLSGTSVTEVLQNLKEELLRPDAMMEWDLRHLLDHLKPRLTPEAHELVEALSAAINDRAAMKHLETLPAWRKAVP